MTQPKFKFKSYSHTIAFTDYYNVGKTFSDLHCTECLGTGNTIYNLSPGAIIQYYPKETVSNTTNPRMCNACSGKGIPPIPAIELKL